MMEEHGAKRRKFIGRFTQLAVAVGIAGFLLERFGNGGSTMVVQGDDSSPTPVTTTTSLTTSLKNSNDEQILGEAKVGNVAGVLALQPRSTDPPNRTGLYQMYFFDDGTTHELRVMSPSGTVTSFPTK